VSPNPRSQNRTIAWSRAAVGSNSRVLAMGKQNTHSEKNVKPILEIGVRHRFEFGV
jgi:hypothetical protein